MKFLIPMPGLIRYPPEDFQPGSEHWQARLTCADWQRVARTAEELGFDGISVSEHHVVPVALEPNMGGWYPHAFTAMAFIAGATSKILVNCMASPLPYHHPVSMAKMISTLDVLSGGRVLPTFSVGMARGEFDALGVPFEKRGRITDEYIAAMKTLWSEPRPEFKGEYVQFSDVVFEPKPLQQPHPPLWFGGRSLAAMRRAAREGDGWAPSGGFVGKGPWFEDPEQLPELLSEIWEIRSAGGNSRPFDVHLSINAPRLSADHTLLAPLFAPQSAQEIVDEIGRLEALGVTWTTAFRLRPNAEEKSLDDYFENLQWIAGEVLAKCH